MNVLVLLRINVIKSLKSDVKWLMSCWWLHFGEALKTRVLFQTLFDYLSFVVWMTAACGWWTHYIAWFDWVPKVGTFAMLAFDCFSGFFSKFSNGFKIVLDGTFVASRHSDSKQHNFWHHLPCKRDREETQQDPKINHTPTNTHVGTLLWASPAPMVHSLRVNRHER